ncbi:hypothetical protein ACFQW4_06640 [Pantoea sp. GCM10028869]|uniref:hypothetical protein n=1 Tax=Pantoea sp. GCM10028869 TaxID=3273417 RepID=UPI003617A095
MRERGIIFNAEMVRAVLEGRKTQTRRAIKHQPFIDGDFWKMDHAGWGRGLQLAPHGAKAELYLANHCPFGAVGDRLWVRETFRVHSRATDVATLVYRASERQSWTQQTHRVPVVNCSKPVSPENWTPSIHMPRWASRITLEITGVRVERLQDISESDAVAEGIEPLPLEPDMPQFYHEYFPIGIKNDLRCNMSAASSFSGLWEAIYGKESWQADPWVWVIEFKRVEGVHVQTS